MILVGALVGLPTALVGLLVSNVMNRLGPVEMRNVEESSPKQENEGRFRDRCDAMARESSPTFSDEEEERRLPSLWLSALPILLPVLLISFNTFMDTFYKGTPHCELGSRGRERQLRSVPLGHRRDGPRASGRHTARSLWSRRSSSAASPSSAIGVSGA